MTGPAPLEVHGRRLPGDPWPAARVAELVAGRLVLPDGEAPLVEGPLVEGVAELPHAGPADLAYAEGRLPGSCAAGLLLVAEARAGRACVVVADPKLAMIAVLEAAFPEEALAWTDSDAVSPGRARGLVHPTARVHPDATVHPSARLAAGVRVHAGARVGAEVEVGEDSVIFENAVLYPRTLLGRRCRIHAGAVLGADGFSYHPTPAGPRKVPQVGRVRLGDEVEVGAGTCIDRAFLGETVVGSRSKLDNLVQIGHNSRLGRGVVVAGQAGLSGSVTVGDGVLLGGQVGVADHAWVGAGARVAARSGLHGRVAPGARLFGAPAMPLRVARRVVALLPRLPELWRRVRDLERRLDAPAEGGPGGGGDDRGAAPQSRAVGASGESPEER